MHLGGSRGRHLGESVSALLDEQLDPETTERAWAHVFQCPDCRRLVEREGWVKTRLASSGGRAAAGEPSPRLVEALRATDAWAAVDRIEERQRGRRVGLAVAGAGSVSAAVLGFATLGGAPLGIGGATPGTPPTHHGPPATVFSVRPGASSTPAPSTTVRYDQRGRRSATSPAATPAATPSPTAAPEAPGRSATSPTP